MKRALLLAVLLAAGPAQAQEFQSGNQLLSNCEADDISRKSVCLGYVVGAHDAFSGSSICSPDNVTQGQVRDVVVRWLRANPDKRHISADRTVMIALGSVWPCANQPSRAPLM